MLRHGLLVVLTALIATAAYGQQPPSVDPEACEKHCREMAATRQKVTEQREAAWKEIEGQLETAKKATGEKKVAALESVVAKLVAYQASGPEAGEKSCPMMNGHAHHAMAGHSMGCCAGNMKDGAHGSMGSDGHGSHCAMSQGVAGPPEEKKPAN